MCSVICSTAESYISLRERKTSTLQKHVSNRLRSCCLASLLFITRQRESECLLPLRERLHNSLSTGENKYLAFQNQETFAAPWDQSCTCARGQCPTGLYREFAFNFDASEIS